MKKECTKRSNRSKQFITPQNNLTNHKQDLRANGLSLPPLALRPGLKFLHHPERQNQPLSSLFRKLSLATILLSFCLILQNSYTSDVSATSITLTIPSEPLSLNITDVSTGESFHKSSASSFSVKTDSTTGYTLSIKAKNSDSDAAKSNDLINSTSTSAKLSSILSATSEADFSSSGAANTWGYLPSKLNGSENTDFLPGPTSEVTVLDNT